MKTLIDCDSDSTSMKIASVVGARPNFIKLAATQLRCGHMQSKTVISQDEYLLKLKAALDARTSKDFIIVARTDARASQGLEEAIKRGKAYYKAGAGVIFIEAPTSIGELTLISNEIDAPLVANMIEAGVTPNLSARKLVGMGYTIALFPLSALFAATFAMREALKGLKENGTTEKARKTMVTFNEFNKLVELQRYKDLERRYA
jgi:2-methylisocitrate lyase-like PEP mutase family enzyme